MGLQTSLLYQKGARTIQIEDGCTAYSCIAINNAFYFYTILPSSSPPLTTTQTHTHTHTHIHTHRVIQLGTDHILSGYSWSQQVSVRYNSRLVNSSDPEFSRQIPGGMQMKSLSSWSRVAASKLPVGSILNWFRDSALNSSKLHFAIQVGKNYQDSSRNLLRDILANLAVKVYTSRVLEARDTFIVSNPSHSLSPLIQKRTFLYIHRSQQQPVAIYFA